MSEKDKRIVIIAGTLVLALIVLLLFRRGGAGAGNTTVVNGAPFTMPAANVSFGPIYYGDSPFTLDIPGLNLSGPDLSMIGACCSDCMQSNQQFYQPQYDTGGNTYVFDAGNQGPNVYNYYAPAPTAYVAPQHVISAMG